MSDETKKQEAETTKQEKVETKAVAKPAIEEAPPVLFVTEKEVTLPSGGTRLIKKLKAGRHYEAQQIYANWISSLQKILLNAKVDLSKGFDKDGKADIDKFGALIEKNKELDSEALLAKAQEASIMRISLLAVCLGETEDEISDNYYAEDLEVLLDTAVELNNFLGTLKKSVAPITGGGARKLVE